VVVPPAGGAVGVGELGVFCDRDRSSFSPFFFGSLAALTGVNGLDHEIVRLYTRGIGNLIPRGTLSIVLKNYDVSYLHVLSYLLPCKSLRFCC
jgi:hypothetical protein